MRPPVPGAAGALVDVVAEVDGDVGVVVGPPGDDVDDDGVVEVDPPSSPPAGSGVQEGSTAAGSPPGQAGSACPGGAGSSPPPPPPAAPPLPPRPAGRVVAIGPTSPSPAASPLVDGPPGDGCDDGRSSADSELGAWRTTTYSPTSAAVIVTTQMARAVRGPALRSQTVTLPLIAVA
jgi:hypothetical protein